MKYRIKQIVGEGFYVERRRWYGWERLKETEYPIDADGGYSFTKMFTFQNDAMKAAEDWHQELKAKPTIVTGFDLN